MRSIALAIVLMLGLPALADTPPPQSINAKVQDGAGNAIGSAVVSSARGLNFHLIDSSIAVTIASLPLPSGGATAANQATEIASLSSMDLKMPALGQALMAASVPVTLASNQSALAVKLQDGSGNAITSTTGALNVNISNTSGLTTVNQGTGGSSAWKVDGSAVTQPVSASSLPLPSGASTSAKQPSLGTAGTASSDVITVQGIASMTALKTDSSATTQPVSAATLPLPSGAATLAAQSTGNSSLSSIDGKITAVNTGAVVVSSSALPAGASTSALQTSGNSSLTSIDGKIPSALTVSSTRLLVDGSGVTQPVSGTVAATQSGTWKSVLTDGTLDLTKLFDLDTSGLTHEYDLGVVLRTSGSGGSVAFGTGSAPIRVDPTGSTTQPVSASALPLPSGASTAAAQTTGNSSLSSIDGKLPSNLTVSSTRLLVDPSGVTQPVSGPLTDAQLRASAVPVSVSSSALPTGAATAARQDTGNTSLSSIDGKITAVNTGAVVVSSSALPSGAATAAKQPALGVAGTASADVLTVQGKSGMTALLVDGSGVTQPVSGTVTANAGSGTMAVSAAALPLPSGASTSALQTTGNTSLSSIDGKMAALGQTTMSGSMPVAIASNQSAIPASQSGTWTVQPGNTANTTAWKVDGSAVTQPVSLSGNQAVNVAQINGVTPLMGNGGTGTGSQRVTIASDNTAFSVNAVQSGNWNVQYNAVNSAGSHTTGTVSTVITLTAPSNAIGFMLEAKDANTANMRWAVGATATTSSGMQIQPGRDTGYVPAGANVSLVSESGTQEYQIQWVLTH